MQEEGAEDLQIIQGIRSGLSSQSKHTRTSEKQQCLQIDASSVWQNQVEADRGRRRVSRHGAGPFCRKSCPCEAAAWKKTTKKKQRTISSAPRCYYSVPRHGKNKQIKNTDILRWILCEFTLVDENMAWSPSLAKSWKQMKIVAKKWIKGKQK